MSDQSSSREVAVIQEPSRALVPEGVFSGSAAFENAQRMAKALASSDLVPQAFKGNIANCLVALEVAQRTGSSALAVLQNLHIIHGRPSWSSQYIIGALNSCGRFAPIRFLMKGEGDKRSCVAWTTDKTGERLEGPEVSIAMAKTEGWFGKSGSKWQTMPELMLRYRAAAFFGRLYAPDILMGMQSDDEIRDVTPEAEKKTNSVSGLNEKIQAKKVKSKQPDAVDSQVTAGEGSGQAGIESPANEGEFF